MNLLTKPQRSLVIAALVVLPLLPINAGADPIPDDVLPLDFEPVNISGNGEIVTGFRTHRGRHIDVYADPDAIINNDYYGWRSTIIDYYGPIFGADVYGISNGTDSLFVSGSIRLESDATPTAFVFGGPVDSDPELRLLGSYDDYTYSAAYDVSDDGSMAVGEEEFDNGDYYDYRAVWWRDTTDSDLAPTLLQPLVYDDGAWANAMDGAGTRAVGASYYYDWDAEEYITQAVYWNLSGESPLAVSLGSLVAGGQSEANDISRNGEYIVGWADTVDGEAPFISYLGGAMSQISAVDSLYSQFGEALGVSNNGTTVGYFSSNCSCDSLAFVASPVWGTKTVNQWLTETGAQVSDDLHYDTATAISEDGKVIVGVAEGSGFIARAGSGSIDPVAFHETLGASGSIPQQGFNTLNMSLHGAHHIPLQMMKGPSRHFWVTGDGGRWDRYNTNSYLAEVGGAVDLFEKQLLVGFGFGQNMVQQKLGLGGDSNLDGQYYLTELSYKPKALPLVFTLTGILGNWDAKIDRHYLTAGLIDSSTGRPHLNSSSLRFSVHWLDAVKVAGFGITPKAEYTVNNTQMGGFAEQGGAFPAFFNKQSHVVHEARYGFSAARPCLGDKALLRLRAEGVHRFDKSGAGTSGQVIGLFGFNLPGQKIKQDWVQFGGDFVYSISSRTNLTASVSTATAGQDPVIGGSIGVQVKY